MDEAHSGVTQELDATALEELRDWIAGEIEEAKRKRQRNDPHRRHERDGWLLMAQRLRTLQEVQERLP